MFGMGMGEIILIAIVALLVLGPERLPSAAKAIGKGIRDLRAQTRDLQQTIEKDTELGDAVRELRGALRGDPETLYERVTGQRFSDDAKAPKGPSQPILADGSPADGSSADGSSADGSSPDGSSADGSSPTGDADDEIQDIAKSEPSAPVIANTMPAQVDLKGDTEWIARSREAAPLDPDQPVIRSAVGAVARSSGHDGDDTDDDDANHG